MSQCTSSTIIILKSSRKIHAELSYLCNINLKVYLSEKGMRRREKSYFQIWEEGAQVVLCGGNI
jgi:hypothetical protein